MSVFFCSFFRTRLLKSRDRREGTGGSVLKKYYRYTSVRYIMNFITGRGRSYTHNIIIIILFSRRRYR